MALTKPKLSQNIDTDISVFTDPILVLHQGSTLANVDTGFLFNRANGLVSNVAIYWSESANSFVTAFTTSSGAPDANVAPTQFANIRLGTATANVLQSDEYRYSNGAAFVSTTLANTAEVTANLASGENVGLSLTATGVAAGNYGSATSIPTIVVDSKGRITSLTANAVSTTINLAGTSGSGSVAGGGTLTVNGTTNQITTSVSSSTITIAFATDVTAPGNLTVTGNLTVQGNTTTFNTETLTVEDLNITVANGAASAAAADGAGLTVAGANARLLYKSATDSWVFDKGVFASGNLVANSGTTSSSTTTGALVVAGGAGISGALYIQNTGDVSANIGAFYNYANTKIGTNTNSNLVAVATTTSTSTTTGALVVAGGVGVAGNLNVGSGTSGYKATFASPGAGTSGVMFIGAALNSSGNGLVISSTTRTTADNAVPMLHLIARDGTVALSTTVQGNTVIGATTTSTSTTTGALVVKGGAGIAGTLYTGVLNINGAYQFPTTDGQYSGQVLTTNGSGVLTFANVTGGGGGSAGFPTSTTTTYPTGDYGTGEPSGIGTGGAATDAFEVPLGTLYDCMEPRGSLTTVDLNI